MCNLSYDLVEQGINIGIEQGINIGVERGIEQGIERGIERGILIGRAESVDNILDLSPNLSLEDACERSKISVEDYLAVKQPLQ